MCTNFLSYHINAVSFIYTQLICICNKYMLSIYYEPIIVLHS